MKRLVVMTDNKLALTETRARGRPPKATTDQRLNDNMARLGYSSVLPGLDLAIQELATLRQRIVDLVSPHTALPSIEVMESDDADNDIQVQESEPEPVVIKARRGRPPGIARRPGPPPGYAKGPMNEAGKEKLRARTEYRWRIVREAGLTSKYLPSNALVHKAETIIARRARKAG
jgi:hypothetical protein